MPNTEPMIRARTPFRFPAWLAWTLVILVIGLTWWPIFPGMIDAFRVARLKTPDLALWQAQPLDVQIHVYFALTALAIGAVVLAHPKGRGLHKLLGWSWIVAMTGTALSSFFITDLNGGALSFIHLLSGWTLIALPMGLYAIRKGSIRGHRRAMVSMYFGGLILAGALTFVPGRVMWAIFLG